MCHIITTAVDAWIRRHVVNAAPPPTGLAPATVVTGGSEGIGLAIARRFRKMGHAVVLVARNRETLAAAAADLRQTSGPDVHTVSLDLTAAGAPDALDTALQDRGLYTDVLVNNAGIGLGGAFSGHDEKAIRSLVDLNIVATTTLMRHVLPHMLARGRGGILNVSSLGGYAPGPWQAAYYASKAYVLSLSQAVAAENRGRGVRICVLAPGPVDTGFHADMGAETALYRTVVPAMSPDRVAWSALWGYRLARPVIVPGIFNRLAALAMRVTPHILLIPIVGWLLLPRRLAPPKQSNP